MIIISLKYGFNLKLHSAPGRELLINDKDTSFQKCMSNTIKFFYSF